MKNPFILLAMLVCFSLQSQTKLADDIYMQADPTHIAKTYKNILFKTNADGKVNDAIVEALTNHGFNPISYNTLFPAIREYSKEEIDKVLKEKAIDLNIVVDVQTKQKSPAVTFNSYSIGGNQIVFPTEGNVVNMFFSMFLFDIGNDTPFVRVDGKVYSEGSYSKRSRPLTIKFLNKSLAGLYENKVMEKIKK